MSGGAGGFVVRPTEFGDSFRQTRCLPNHSAPACVCSGGNVSGHAEKQHRSHHSPDQSRPLPRGPTGPEENPWPSRQAHLLQRRGVALSVRRMSDNPPIRDRGGSSGELLSFGVDLSQEFRGNRRSHPRARPAISEGSNRGDRDWLGDKRQPGVLSCGLHGES